jgi:acyl phosphate:glycerol-3-phosphate acyltransferase
VHPALAILLSYVSGSIPAAFLAGRWGGVDLRAQGSGNLGATNVLRVLGPRVAAVVFAVDIAKGALPVRFLPPLTSVAGDARVWLAIACGAAAIAGHVRPVFLRFGKGGKGVATACGVFLALAPLETLLALLIFVVVVLASGYVSLASLTAAVSLPVLLAASEGIRSPLFIVSLVVALFVFWTHRANIQRLRSGSEYRFGRAANFGRRPSLALGVALLVLAAAYLAARVG